MRYCGIRLEDVAAILAGLLVAQRALVESPLGFVAVSLVQDLLEAARVLGLEEALDVVSEEDVEVGVYQLLVLAPLVVVTEELVVGALVAVGAGHVCLSVLNLKGYRCSGVADRS